MNAFSIPAKGLDMGRKKSDEQQKKDLLRKNPFDPICTKHDYYKTWAIQRGGI